MNKPFEIIFSTTADAKRLGFTDLRNVFNDTVKINLSTLPKTNNLVEFKFKLSYFEITEHAYTFKDNLYITDLEQLQTYLADNCSDILTVFELQKDKVFRFSINSNLSQVKFDANLTKTLGLTKPVCTQNEQICEGTNKPKILKHHQQMFIYSNIVEPVIVGDSSVPLMKSIWIEKHDQDEVVQINVENPMYLPVSTSCINNIEINIRDDSGQLIEFPKGSKTHLTLHFRKING